MKRISIQPRLLIAASFAILSSACSGTGGCCQQVAVSSDLPEVVAAAEPVKNGQDWPTLGGGLSRNPVNTTAKNVPIDWSNKEGNHKNIKWVAQLGTTTYGGPVIADGKVFVGTNNQKPRDPKIKGSKSVLMCFRASDGQFLWQNAHNQAPRDVVREAINDGLCSTPTVGGKFVYYVTSAGEVICAGTDNGKIEWRLDMMKKLNVFPCYVANCSPLIVGEVVYVVTGNGRDSDHQVSSPKAPSFLAINKKSGDVIWQKGFPGNEIIDGQWSNPVYAEVNGKGQVIFPGADGWLWGLDAKTGDYIWKFNCNPKSATPYRTGSRGTQGFILATPVVWENKVYATIAQEPENDSPKVGHLWCVDITKTGDLSPVNDNWDPKAAVNKNSGLVWHFGGPTPKDSPRDYYITHVIGSSTVHDGLLYAADYEGFAYCLDARTGKKYWEEDFKSAVWGSPYWVEGKLYFASDQGDVFIFAHGKEKKLLGKIEMEPSIRSAPVVANGVLYIMTNSQLYAIGSK